MNSATGQSDGEQNLGSWHPAHMPSSDSASSSLANSKQLPNTVAADSISSQSDSTPNPNVILQSRHSSSHRGGAEGPKSSTNETVDYPEINPQPFSEIFTSDAGDSRTTDGEPSTEEDNQDQQRSSLINGLNFVSPPLQPGGPSSLHSNESGHFTDNKTSTEQMDQDSHTKFDGQTLLDLGTMNRSNSFPAVPPLHRVRGDQYQAHVQLRVNDIVEEDDEFGDGVKRSFDGDNPQQTDQMDLVEGNFLGDLADKEDDDFFSHSVGVDDDSHSYSPVDDEARFEEGLPLMHSESMINEGKDDSMRKDVSSERPPSSSQSTSDQDFFGKEADQDGEPSFFQPKQLDRKTTSQVLDGLSYHPRTSAHNEPSPQKGQSPLENVSGGDIAASSSTVVSPVGDEDLAAMWQAALDDDDLLDDTDLTSSEPVASTNVSYTNAQQRLESPDPQLIYGADGNARGFESSAIGRDGYSSTPGQQNMAPSYYPGQSSITGQQSQVSSLPNLSHSSSAPSGFRQPTVQRQPQGDALNPTRPRMPKPAQSFSNKSKGGYTSPYDLPMDVTRPKKRTNLQQVQNASNSRTPAQPPPPPRSSSMYTRSSANDGLFPPVPPKPSVSASPPHSDSRPISSNLQSKPSVGSFFEELPMTKSRPSSSAGRYAPTTSPQISTQLPPLPEPSRHLPSTQQQPANAFKAAPSYQPVPPGRHSPYANLPQQDALQNPPPQISSRYSPAVGLQSHVPPSRNRYADSPGANSRPPPSTHAIPFQPRTSSPLAQTSTSSQQRHHHSSVPRDVLGRSPSPHQIPTTQNALPHPAVLPPEEHSESSAGHDGSEASPGTSSLNTRSIQDHPPFHSQPSAGNIRNRLLQNGAAVFTPDSENSLASLQGNLIYPLPQPQESVEDLITGPPRRSQTQSPGTTRHRPEVFKRMEDVRQRPTSAAGRLSPVRAEHSALASHAPTRHNANSPSHDLNYIRPNDGREHDPLERWKGAPILKFGFGGIIATSFPKRIPRYTAGHGFPMIKCNPGEVRLQTSNIGTLSDDIARFPGPLKSKGKKKEILEWLQLKIDALESAQASIAPTSSLPDSVKKHEEKILLWKSVGAFVEYDGTITSNSKATNAIRTILCPAIANNGNWESPSGRLSAGISKPEGMHSAVDQMSPGAMETVQRLLLQGEREKAVWHAVDQRMWAHAMVLSSTLDKSVWKQVLHEFTRLEVKTQGENSESLAALYEVFAGNWEESIDQLVPPSARAGLQMVSKVASAGPIRNALDGLDRWRETLTFILSNRTQDDENALGALGRLLAGYGRTEAAHLCLIFAKVAGLFGGMEETHASIALLGVDHQQQPFDYGRDLDSILLTEVYEFVRSVLMPSANLSFSPHLQSYKLYHAMLLADHGYRSEAQQYCDAIMSTLKSTTKPSPYYHSLLFNALDDLVERLQQAPRDTSSWISKPMDKVSGSMWKKFNNFIVGDEGDAASIASGKGEQDTGPFARVAADTPSISRSGSSIDLYSTMTSQAAPPLPADTAFGSRYAPSNHIAPSGQYTPRSSLEQQTRPSEEHQRHGQPSMLRPSQQQPSYLPIQPRYTASPAPHQEPSVQQQKQRYQPSPYISPKPDEFLPTPPSQPEYMPIAPPDEPFSSLYPPEPYQLSNPSESQAPQVYDLHDERHPNSSYESSQSTYEANTSSYEPPSSYAPYNPDGQEDHDPKDQKSPTKKKSFMDDDDDDDFAARAAAILKGDKARKDKEADEVFRKAAEADGRLVPVLQRKHKANSDN